MAARVAERRTAITRKERASTAGKGNGKKVNSVDAPSTKLPDEPKEREIVKAAKAAKVPERKAR